MKNNKFILAGFLICLLTFFSSYKVFSQVSYEITYVQTQISPYSDNYDWGKGKEMPLALKARKKTYNPELSFIEKSEYLLLHYNDISVYKNIRNTITNFKGETPPDGRKPRPLKERLIYKNWKTNKILAQNGNDLWVTNFEESDWTILGLDELEIFGYRLSKATTKTKEDFTVTAWFSEDLPIQNGPNFLMGLPGLILKARIHNTIYTATDIKISKTKFEGISTPTFEPTLFSYEEWVESIKKGR